MGSQKNGKWIPLDVDTHDDPKIMDLESALGMEGYGTYIMLIQYLAKQEPEYTLPLKQLKHLAYRHRISEEKILAVVNHFNLFVIENECFYSPSLLRRMERYDNLKNINREKANIRWNKSRELTANNAAALPEHYNGNADKNRIDKNRIDKNIKKNSNKYKNIPPSIEDLKLRIEERKIESFTADSFHAYYESNGWLIGKNKMKDWDAALTTWNKRNSQHPIQRNGDSRSIKKVNDLWKDDERYKIQK